MPIPAQLPGNIVIGCDGLCPRCAGGWPGTRASGAALLDAAKSGRLIPERLGCGTLVEQGRMLARMTDKESSCVA